MNYQDFLTSKIIKAENSGFTISAEEVHPALFGMLEVEETEDSKIEAK